MNIGHTVLWKAGHHGVFFEQPDKPNFLFKSVPIMGGEHCRKLLIMRYFKARLI